MMPGDAAHALREHGVPWGQTHKSGAARGHSDCHTRKSSLFSFARVCAVTTSDLGEGRRDRWGHPFSLSLPDLAEVGRESHIELLVTFG